MSLVDIVGFFKFVVRFDRRRYHPFKADTRDRLAMTEDNLFVWNDFQHDRSSAPLTIKRWICVFAPARIDKTGKVRPKLAEAGIERAHLACKCWGYMQ